jgi:hypothetical protein
MSSGSSQYAGINKRRAKEKLAGNTPAKQRRALMTQRESKYDNYVPKKTKKIMEQGYFPKGVKNTSTKRTLEDPPF